MNCMKHTTQLGNKYLGKPMLLSKYRLKLIDKRNYKHIFKIYFNTKIIII